MSHRIDVQGLRHSHKYFAGATLCLYKQDGGLRYFDGRQSPKGAARVDRNL